MPDEIHMDPFDCEGRARPSDRAARLRPQPASQSSRSRIPRAAIPKIRLIINDSHVALVLRVKRELCVGEEVRAA